MPRTLIVGVIELTGRCVCTVDIEMCPVHDWSKEVEIPSRREEKRQREIKRGMHLTSGRKDKRQEF